jgi:hypothetical protein
VPIRVFFSFDFTEDLWRASVVRNRWIPDPSLAEGGFWEPRFSNGDPPRGPALERFVDDEIGSSDVTVVLIGSRTAFSDHVLHAIRRSIEVGHPLVGIYIDQCKNRYGSSSLRGRNPFDAVTVTRNGVECSLGDIVSTYDWVEQDGFTNLQAWIDEAMGRLTEGSTKSGFDPV